MVRKLTRREKVLLLIFIEMVFAILLVQFWILPSFDKIVYLKKEKEQLLFTANELQFYKEQENKLQDEVNHLINETNKLKNQIQPIEKTHLYWEKVYEVATNEDLEIMYIQENKEKEDSLIGNIRINGDYENLIRFINRLESIPYIYAIKEGSFTPQGERMALSLTLIFGVFGNLNETDSSTEKIKNINHLLENNLFN